MKAADFVQHDDDNDIFEAEVLVLCLRRCWSALGSEFEPEES